MGPAAKVTPVASVPLAAAPRLPVLMETEDACSGAAARAMTKGTSVLKFFMDSELGGKVRSYCGLGQVQRDLQVIRRCGDRV